MQNVDKKKIISDYQINEKDVGSTPVQVALITHKIKHLTGHFKNHTKDNHSRRGLLKLVSRRKKLLSYLKQNNFDAYSQLIKRLSLRK